MNPERTGWFCGAQRTCDPVPPIPETPSHLVLLGPPGVGKGTQARLLCDRLLACHLSTGDLFREAICGSDCSSALQQAAAAMRRGELVPDHVVIEMVRERAACLACQGGFVLDGFPRTVRQAEALEAILGELGMRLDGVLSYDVPVEEVIARLSGRRTCSSCRTVYHLAARPPQVADVCDECGGQLLQRDDDHPSAIRVRMKIYAEETAPLLDFYDQRGLLFPVPATGTPGEVFERTLAVLEHAGLVTL